MTSWGAGAPPVVRCPQCGTTTRGDARFCGVCGAATASTEPASSAGLGPAPAMIGREIAGRYRVLAKLGEGGMGAVFRAEQISLKRTVAVKLLRPDVSANPMLLRRFNAEAEVVAKLSHPSTVNIYDFGQDADGTLFIAMELIDGVSLRALIQREAPLPVHRTLAIAAQIAASLADAHAHGIVHRDLKPDNVMLADRGRERDVVRVLDFGIAKLRDDTRATQAAMTQHGDMLGTPQYMAPEQIRAEAIDGRTDIYALGCLLYEMVTGRLPHDAETVLAMLSKHLLEAPIAPTQRRPDLGLPPAIDPLILGAMAKDPRARPPAMEAFGEQLAALRASLPPEPRPVVPAPAPSPVVMSPGFSVYGAAMPAPGSPPPGAPGTAGYPPLPAVQPPLAMPPPGVAATPLPGASGIAGYPAVGAAATPLPGAPGTGGYPPTPAAPPPGAVATPPLGASGIAGYPPTALVQPPVVMAPPPAWPGAPERHHSPRRLGLILAIGGVVVAGGTVIGVVAATRTSPPPADRLVYEPPARVPVSEDRPDAAPATLPPSEDPWAAPSPSPAPAIPPPSRSVSPPPAPPVRPPLAAGKRVNVGQGVALIIPAGFQVKTQNAATVAFDKRGVAIAAGPIDIASNDTGELAQYYARTSGLSFEATGTAFVGGVQRPMAIFHGLLQRLEVRHFAVPLIGRGYRVAVVFQVPVRLAADPSVQRLLLEFWPRRIVVP